MKTGSRVLLVCLIMLPFGGWAQFTKGSKYIGGYLNYDMIARTDAETFDYEISFNPTLGYLIGENLALGLRLGSNYNFHESSLFPSGTRAYESKSFSAGVFVAKYLPLADKFWFSINGGVNYQRGFLDSLTPGYAVPDSDYYQINASVRPEFLFFPSPRWAITMSIGSLSYSHRQLIGSGTVWNQVNFGLGSIGFGLLYFFK